MSQVRMLVVVAAVVAVIAAACGDGDGQATDETLPPAASDVESPPDPAAACREFRRRLG